VSASTESPPLSLVQVPDEVADTTEDAALMLRFAAGDAASFDTLYERFRVPLYNFVRRMCRNSATTDELYQETWTRLIASRDQYRPDYSFKAYLFRIAHNLLMDHFRRQSVRKESSLAELELAGFEPATLPTESPEEEFALKDKAMRLMQLIDSLPPEQRETFLLRREFDHGLEAIAEMTGVPLEAVRSRLRYALKKLKAGLGD